MWKFFVPAPRQSIKPQDMENRALFGPNKVCFPSGAKITKRNKRDTKLKKEYRKGGNNGKFFWIVAGKKDVQLLHFCYKDSILKSQWGKVG